MTAVGSDRDRNAGLPVPQTPAVPGGAGLGRRLRNALVILVALPFLLLTAGFLLFMWRVPSHEVALVGQADGIVVLTGGASRVTDALELLASKRGQRLLISGVHHATRPEEIARSAPEFQTLFACCVDLDRAAVNTTGNAAGARLWAKENGYRSLIVVTSNYHIPRAMAELVRQLPEVELIPFPVVPDRTHDGGWPSWATAKLLVFEYLKYVVAVARITLDDSIGPA